MFLCHRAVPKGVLLTTIIIYYFQTQLILTTCQIRYHSHLWDHRSTGRLRTVTPRRYLEYCEVSGLHQLIFGLSQKNEEKKTEPKGSALT